MCFFYVGILMWRGIFVIILFMEVVGVIRIVIVLRRFVCFVVFVSRRIFFCFLV